MKKYLLLSTLIISLFTYSCSNVGEGYQEYISNVSCDDHPHLNDNQKKVCKAQVDGKIGTGQKSASEILEGYFPDMSKGSGNYTGINKWLWQGSIETVGDYPLKIADAFGGVIETDWITNAENIDERCSIKILINSDDFVANGLSANLICQKFNGTSWILVNKDYGQQNNKIENSILEKARKNYLKFNS